jgi:uncharacterized protein with beta-barrel porin domain
MNNSIHENGFGNTITAVFSHTVKTGEVQNDTITLGAIGKGNNRGIITTYIGGMIKSCGIGCKVDVGVSPIDSTIAEDTDYFITDADLSSAGSVDIAKCSTLTVNNSHDITLTYKNSNPTVGEKVEVILTFVQN